MGWQTSAVRPEVPATSFPPMKCPMFRMGALLTAVFAGRLPLPPGRGYRVRNGEREPEMASKLDQLRAMTVIVADTGDIEAVRRLKPEDCTTNPTLLLKAVEIPAYAHHLDEALHGGRREGGAPEAVAAVVCDRLAVAFGAELAGIVPGRASTEVDADLSFDTAGTVEKARAIMAAYAARGVPREKILIKIASTWEGVRAAEVLQREGI